MKFFWIIYEKCAAWSPTRPTYNNRCKWLTFSLWYEFWWVWITLYSLLIWKCHREDWLFLRITGLFPTFHCERYEAWFHLHSQIDECGSNDDDWDIEMVSDAKVLLACWSYLQRINQLQEWTAAHQRKRRHQRRTQTEAGVMGYFWENPGNCCITIHIVCGNSHTTNHQHF
jgi:hypothetical protein